MDVPIDSHGNVVSFTDDATKVATLTFEGNAPQDLRTAATGRYTVTGSAPRRKLMRAGEAAPVALEAPASETAPELSGLPAGGTEGQVLTKASSTDGDAGWEDPASGASGVELVDLGVINAVDLLDGQVTLITPGAGQVVWGLYLADVEFISGGSVYMQITVPALSAGKFNESGVLGVIDTDLVRDFYTTGRVQSPESVLDGITDQPVVARLTSSAANVILSPTGLRQSNHAYAEGALIRASGTNDGDQYWQAAAGTSGGSDPGTWDYADSPVTDGTVEWTVIDLVPTAGSVHAYINRATLATP